MQNVQKTLLLCVMLSSGLLIGCAGQPEPGLNKNSNQEIINTRAVDTSYPGLTRVIGSNKLIGYIAVVNPKLGKKGSFTKAQTTVQNLTENRYQVEYQYQWEDSSGFSIGTPRPWNRFVLGPKQAKNISEMALQNEAAKTIFTVRLVDDTFIELNKQKSK